MKGKVFAVMVTRASDTTVKYALFRCEGSRRSSWYFCRWALVRFSISLFVVYMFFFSFHTQNIL